MGGLVCYFTVSICISHIKLFCFFVQFPEIELMAYNYFVGKFA